MRIDDLGYLEHVHWGKSLGVFSSHSLYPALDRGYSTNVYEVEDRSITLEHKFLELSTYGNGDFRESSLILRFEDGTYINDFRYASHTIYDEKLQVDDLASSYGLGQTLEICLKDHYEDVFVKLYYHVFEGSDAFSRQLEIVNKSGRKLEVLKALSMNLDFLNDDYEVMGLSGMWGQERNVKRFKIGRGTHHFDSKRGTSSHFMAPFIGILNDHTTQHQGDVYSINLVHSGSFQMTYELDGIDQLRVQAGIQSLDNQIILEVGECFMTPEAVLSYSAHGLNGIMHVHHDFVNHHIIPKKDLDRFRPTLINNWEATYFDFDEAKILDIGSTAKRAGIELLVLDDGWFGKRNNDDSSLGDWFINSEKLPKGLKSIADQIHAMDMQFGLWIEPEMISFESELYKSHPEYLLSSKDRNPTPSRTQYVLDYSSKEVVDHIYNQLCLVFDELELDYVKWDMNRPLVQQYSLLTQKLVPNINYVKGVYDLIKRLKQRYPKILFEACAGGGGRFDWGILNYFPQVWTSDNTDAIERLKIQEGSVLIFPQKTMGAHVSDVPNHQTQRTTSMEMRFHVTAPFNLGYELDLSKLSDETIDQVKKDVTWYQEHRDLLQNGRFYTLDTPDTNRQKAVMTVSENQDAAIVFVYQTLTSFNDRLWKVKLCGLDAQKIYAIEGKQISGYELMNYGIYLPSTLNEDFKSLVIELKQVEEN